MGGMLNMLMAEHILRHAEGDHNNDPWTNAMALAAGIGLALLIIWALN